MGDAMPPRDPNDDDCPLAIRRVRVPYDRRLGVRRRRLRPRRYQAPVGPQATQVTGGHSAVREKIALSLSVTLDRPSAQSAF